MFFYRVYQVIVMVPLMIVATLLTVLLAVLGTLVGAGQWAGYYPMVAWGRVFCILAGVRVTVRGRDNISRSTSYVFAANHQGAYDIFATYGYLGHDFRWMMKQSLRRIPLVGYACAATGQIFVERGSVSGVRTSMQKAREQLRGGKSIVVFPEGSRTDDGRMHAFKKGAFKLATDFHLPVVPLTIDGSYRVMTKNAKLPRPGRIILTIHPPIFPSAEGYDLPVLMADTRRAIASALPGEEA